METSFNAKKTEWIGGIGFILSFLFACLIFFLAYASRSEMVYVEGWHMLGGIFLWFLLVLHSRQIRVANEEERLNTKTTAAPEKTFFEGEAEDAFSARHALQFFEKWIVPLSTLIIGLLGLVLGIFLVYKLGKQGERPPVLRAPLTASFLGTLAFFSLLFSKYCLGLARHREWRLLRAGGSYLFLNSVFCFGAAVSLALYNLEIKWLEYYLAFVVPFLLALVGFEMLLNLVLDIYRPRLAGQEVHPPYDSRILDLCTGSKGILKTAAHTLDYQFGFQVSETWFYRFLEKAIVPLLLFQFLCLYLIHCLVIVHPEEKAVLERFGSPVAEGILEPGLHFKWPWPIDKVYYYPVDRLLSLRLPDEAEEENEDAEKHGHASHGHTHSKPASDTNQKEAILFSQEHGHENRYFLVANSSEEGVKRESVPVNLLALDVLIHYRIQNLLDYSYRHSYPGHLLEGIAYRELTCFLASTTMQDLLSTKRLEICQHLQQKIQSSCSQNRLGIEIVSISICNVHPPAPIAAEFEAVLGAMEQKETKILEADKYKNQVLPLAEAEAAQILTQAKTYLEKQKNATLAEMQAFENYREAYKKGGDLYLLRKYLKTLEQNLKDHRIYIIDVAHLEKEVDTLNLEDKLRSDLLQLDFNKVEEK